MPKQKKTKERTDKLDIKQAKFLEYYLDNKSDTFSNAYRSALKAGYKEEYARNITHITPKWLSDYIGDFSLINKAEKNLDSLLDGDDDRIKADITKFVLERLKKGKYSSRQEMTGQNGEDIKINIVNYQNKDNQNQE